ncbi:MAG: MBL fold metallo-hydrolase [Woeseiaceae bacterium]|nr:MBL fold metallo-hydrolase [Woeseiaceae bacterium]
MRRIKQAVLVVCALLIVGAATLAWLWSDRPSLANIDWPQPVIATVADGDEVTVTWLGVSTLLFDDGETQVLIDGFFSRPSLADVILDLPVENDAVTINFALYEYRMRRLAALVAVHSHFDHAMDIGAIANRTSASVLGSASTAQIARGAGVPEDQIAAVETGQPYSFGRFTLTLLASKHAPVGWRGSVPYAGTIDAPLKMPQPPSAWREGGSYTIVIEHPQGTTIVQGSAGFTGDMDAAVPADVVMLGIGGLGSLGKDYSERYWQALVTSTGAHSVYPIHFDDYTRPFGDIVPGPRFLGDLETTAAWLDEFRRKWDTDARLFLPVFGQPMAIYSAPEPLPET